MVYANELAIAMGIMQDQQAANRLKKVLSKFELPVALPDNLYNHLNVDLVLNLLKKDKKNSSGD